MAIDGIFKVSSVPDYAQESNGMYWATSAPQTYQVPGSIELWDCKTVGNGGNICQQELYAAKLSHVQVFSKSGALLVSGDVVLHDLLAYHGEQDTFNFGEEPCFSERPSGRTVRFTHPARPAGYLDCAINLVGRHSAEYGHWVLEHLTKFEFLHAHDEYARLPVLVDAEMPASHFESLMAIGGHNRLIIRLPEQGTVTVGTLVEVSSPASNIVGRDLSVPPDHRLLSIPPHTHHFLQSAFKSLAAQTSRTSNIVASKKIIVPRGPDAKRRPCNEEKLLEIAATFGFQIVSIADFNFSEQLALFNSATHIIMVGGSAQLNTFACSAQCRILHLHQQVVGNLANAAHRYNLLGCHGRFLLGTPSSSTTYDRHGNYWIDEKEFSQALKLLLSAS